jgi:hypothetical protein
MRKLRTSGSAFTLVTLVALGAIAAACSGSRGAGSGFTTGTDDNENNDNGNGEGNGNGNGNTNGSGNTNGNGNNNGSLGTGNTDAGTGGSDGGLAGDGPIDTPPPCDVGLAVDDANPATFAKAIGICTQASSAGYGLVSASYSNAWASTAPPQAGQWGFLPTFGSVIVPRQGSAMSALSSGYARQYDDSAGTVNNAPGILNPAGSPFGVVSDFVNSSPDGPREGMNYPTGAAPPGFPQSASGCGQSMMVNDMIDVKLTLKAPPNATGFSFDFDFHSSEWPNFVCSDYNDAFVAYVTSNETTGNVSFDSNKNPIAVNANFFNRCTPNAPVGCLSSDNGPPMAIGTSTCTAGAGELAGTGFADTAKTQCGTAQDINATLGGATGWLTTTAPIKGGEQFTIDFMIWDSGDGLLDSLVLIDNFQWIGGTPVMGPSTNRPPQ